LFVRGKARRRERGVSALVACSETREQERGVTVAAKEGLERRREGSQQSWQLMIDDVAIPFIETSKPTWQTQF
jgi:hypothetical protein